MPDTELDRLRRAVTQAHVLGLETDRMVHCVWRLVTALAVVAAQQARDGMAFIDELRYLALDGLAEADLPEGAREKLEKALAIMEAAVVDRLKSPGE